MAGRPGSLCPHPDELSDLPLFPIVAIAEEVIESIFREPTPPPKPAPTSIPHPPTSISNAIPAYQLPPMHPQPPPPPPRFLPYPHPSFIGGLAPRMMPPSYLPLIQNNNIRNKKRKRDNYYPPGSNSLHMRQPRKRQRYTQNTSTNLLHHKVGGRLYNTGPAISRHSNAYGRTYYRHNASVSSTTATPAEPFIDLTQSSDGDDDYDECRKHSIVSVFANESDIDNNVENDSKHMNNDVDDQPKKKRESDKEEMESSDDDEEKIGS